MQEPCAKQLYEVTHADLPLCCPMPKFRLWDGHPRVYLPIETSGKEICPYCNAEYILTDFVPHDFSDVTQQFSVNIHQE